MIVCVCNRLGEAQCRQMAGRPECRTVAGIYQGLQCRVRCGKCVPFMQEILRAQKENAPAELPEARPAPRS